MRKNIYLAYVATIVLICVFGMTALVVKAADSPKNDPAYQGNAIRGEGLNDDTEAGPKLAQPDPEDYDPVREFGIDEVPPREEPQRSTFDSKLEIGNSGKGNKAKANLLLADWLILAIILIPILLLLLFLLACLVDLLGVPIWQKLFAGKQKEQESSGFDPSMLKH